MLAGLLLLGIAGFSLSAGAVAALPTVTDAQARARRIEQQHGVRPDASVPTRLRRAAVASEDGDFGDPVIMNVAWGAARAGGALVTGAANPGGATIDQQLAKALYPTPTATLDTVRQIGLGIKLGLCYSRRQILDMYLDVNYFGNGFWGAPEAARGYFGVSATRLDWAQAAMLAGLLQAPSADDPFTHYGRAKARQRYVLKRLAEDGVLSPARARAAARMPLGLTRDG